MNEIASIINTVGFPIVAYFVLAKDNKELLRELTGAIKELSISMEGFNVRLTKIEKELLKND